MVPAGLFLPLALLFGLAGATAVELIPVIAAVPTGPATEPVPEYNAKAGYLLAFTRYVEWPAGTLASPTDPIVIGVLGLNPFGDVLERTVRGLKSQGRPIEVRYVHSVAEAGRCQVVFIDRRQEREAPGWLRALRGKPVLTVTESEQDLTQGAVLALVLEKTAQRTTVAFYASLPASREAGLQIRASMLASARKVYREPATTKEQP